MDWFQVSRTNLTCAPKHRRQSAAAGDAAGRRAEGVGGPHGGAAQAEWLTPC